MTLTGLMRSIAAGGLATVIGFTPLAMAANGPAQGETSGPASGSPTTPSTAVQKQVSPPHGSTSAGAPGVASKEGTEAGGDPKAGASGRTAH